MASQAQRARCRVVAWALVLGLTPEPASAAPPVEPAPSVAPAVVTGTVALASLTTAVVFTARSARARRSLSEDLDAGVQYDQDDRRIADGRRDAYIASVMYGATAVVGALTLYYVLRTQTRRRDLAWQLSPSFARRGGGLVLTVGF